MKVENQEKLQYPISPHITDLFTRSGIAQSISPFTYVREPTHCCCVLICSWREITGNYYKNHHATRHVLMHTHWVEIQGFRVKCNSTFEFPPYDTYVQDTPVYVRLRAVENSESYCVEILSITNDVSEALPLARIGHSMEELFQPQSRGSSTYIPCCGILECRRRDLVFLESSVTTKGYHINTHPLFEVSDEVTGADGDERICLKLKVSQQEVKVLSTFRSPVGFCIKNGRCNCEVCKHMVNTYYFGTRILSNQQCIPKDKDVFFITSGLQLSCESKNAVFLISCRRCHGAFQYIGQTLSTTVKERIRSLCYDFKNDKKSRLCNHFRQKDHEGISDWEITIIDQILEDQHQHLNDLEQCWIDRMETLHKQLGGLNMNPAAGQKTILFIADTKLINYSHALKHHDIIPKRCSGKTIEEIGRMAPIIIEREKPKRVILHVGSLEISLEKNSNVIASEIIGLSKALATHGDSMFWISGLLPRDGIKNQKVLAINKLLRRLCAGNKLRFINHSNIDPSSHFKVDRHLNQQGLKLFTQNIDDVFQQNHEEDRKRRSIIL